MAAVGVRGAVPGLRTAGAQAVEAPGICLTLPTRLGSRDKATVVGGATGGDTAQAVAAAVRAALGATHPDRMSGGMVALEWRRQSQATLRITAEAVAVASTQTVIVPVIQEGLAASGVAAVAAVLAMVPALISMADTDRQTLAVVAAARILNLLWLAMEGPAS
ncbi:unnamed protein product [Prorocentrum cordatum]|uniref:Uncharacterized protein n=1 Tax=Prorocentrum cordatum TaxID=2364126 RepID=A0ABN9W4E6_9DINO|nr:unnamed protein product [Polarella glacialis]